MNAEVIEEWGVLIVRMSAVTLHMLGMIGLSIGSTIAVLLIVKEAIEIHKERLRKKKYALV